VPLSRGVLVDEERAAGEAVAGTQALLAIQRSCDLRAAFIPRRRIRVDVLERLPGGAGVREVKSGASVKEVHLHDAALHVHPRRGGVAVPSVEIMHVDGSYGGDSSIDWQRSSSGLT